MVPASEKSLFLAALDKDSAAARAAFLDEACATDAQLRAQVQELLRVHDSADALLDELPQRVGAARAKYDRGAAMLAEPPTEQPGAMIGPYRLMEQIGEGGFGLVFVAEQQQPVKRKVALKIVKPGMDTREVIARFEAERQALALMDHPNIACVLDAGETATGRPYFVMELVRGVSIIDFCDQHQLTTRERLELFVHVCQAVQHAHQKGIIHRDLKPSNVLVTLHDGAPVVKVIDFGVAKAIGQSLTEKTIYTRFAQMIGTPLYMSPEQAEMSGLDIDTRSDIYSLGVLLYELLTGTTPFERARMDTATFDEIRRMIRQEEPPRPSARLTTLGQALPTVSAQRKTEPRKLSALVRGDLDWIVMKALEKDRTRRYETAAAFAADVRRSLNQEPIEARPPSPLYRFAKFSRRNKVALTTGSLVAAALIVGTAVSTWQAIRATSAQADADASRQHAVDFSERLKGANVLLDSARAHADEGRWAPSYADYTLASELQPEHYLVWSGRGSMYLRLGLWKPAALDYAKALTLRAPANNPGWWGVPQLFWFTGDERSYREVCAQMLKQAETSSDGLSLSMIIRSLLVAPSGVAEPADLVRRAEALLPKPPDPWTYGPPDRRGGPGGDRGGRGPGGDFGPPPDHHGGPGGDRGGRGRGDFGPPPDRGGERDGRGDGDFGRGPGRRGPDGMRDGPPRMPGPNLGFNWGQSGTLYYIAGLANYRANEYETAIKQLRDALLTDLSPRRIANHPVLAMAYHRSGQADLAREALAAADKAFDQSTEAMVQGAPGTMPMAWFDWIEFLDLYREARQVVAGAVGPQDPRLDALEQRSLDLIVQP